MNLITGDARERRRRRDEKGASFEDKLPHRLAREMLEAIKP